jgi:hypothetical protein
MSARFLHIKRTLVSGKDEFRLPSIVANIPGGLAHWRLQIIKLLPASETSHGS